MCMICKGLKREKLTPEEAREKLEEFVDLDLLDEEHQEIVETLIAEAEEEEFYWASAKKNVRRFEDYEDEDENPFIEDDDGFPVEEEPYEEDN